MELRDAFAPAVIAGQELELYAERAAYWPLNHTLFVADPHFGKAASFRASGVYVPKGTTNVALDRLNALIERTSPERIVFLGDFLHAREGRNQETFDALEAWRKSHAQCDMILVRGNHDKRAGDPPDCVGMTCVDAPLIDAPFALTHHPVTVEDHYVLAGHIHPCATLVGPARQRERLPCFWFAENVGVLPAFGEFTGLAPIDPGDGDRIWLVADDVVYPMRR